MERLNQHLSELEHTASADIPCRIYTYLDKRAPGASDWKKFHFQSLQTSQALIGICTPGIAEDLSERGQPDRVFEELKWCSRHRRKAPTVLDETGEGGQRFR